jgi:hypothetical protein
VPGELSHRALRFCGVAYSSGEHDGPTNSKEITKG